MHSTSVYDLKLSVLRCTGTKALATDHRENPEQTRNTPGTPPDHPLTPPPPPPRGARPPPPPPTPELLNYKNGQKNIAKPFKKIINESIKIFHL